MSLGYSELLDLVPELLTAFTFGGVEWGGLRGDLTENKELGAGGYALDADIILVVPLAQFTEAGATPPAQKDEITISGEVFRVGSVVSEPVGDFLVLNLYDPNRGA